MTKVELDFLWVILAIFVGTYIVLSGLLRRVNEWYYVRKLGEKRHSLPPGDTGWPLLGNTLSFLRAFKSSDPNTFINNLIKRYGRTGIYKTHLFGSPSIIVCTPETCKRVLMDDEQFGLYCSAAAKRLAGERGFANISKPEHKRLRKLTTNPMIGQESLSMYIGYIEDIVIASIEEWSCRDKPIEFFCEIDKATFKLIIRIMFGSDSDSIFESVEKYYDDLKAGFYATAINIPGFSFYRGIKARNILIKIIQTILDQRRAMKRSDVRIENRGMIHLLMEAEDENGHKLEDEYIIDFILVLLIVGHDSTAHTITWATIYLHQHPHVLQKAKDEQEKIIKKRPSTQKGLSFNEIKQMEYLSKVIDETLRTMNLLFSIVREAKTDVNIKGFTIPARWNVYIWNRSIHLDSENYFAPCEFNPSRWDSHVAKPGSFIPFGAGPRRCPGADVAKLEICTFLHYFLLNYKLEQLNPGCPIVYLPAPKPSDNCLARIVIDETLRTMNLLFSIVREAKTDVNIKGFTIPARWNVYIWNRSIHLDSENYFAPYEFNPSRWDSHVAKPGSFIPFGAGPRRCPGADVAKLEICTFLHYFLLNYKLEQLNPGCPTVYLPAPKPSDNCLARVVKLK